MLMVAGIAALAWFILLGENPAAWIVGAPCIALAAWLSLGRRAPQRMRVSLWGWARLFPYFLRWSLVGGWDVARRVLAPQLAVSPGYMKFRLNIPPGPARTFFVQFIGLLPGTLGAWLDGDDLVVHVLHLDADHETALRAAQERVGAAFAIAVT